MELVLPTHPQSSRHGSEGRAGASRRLPQTWPAKIVAYREELRRAVGAIEERRRRRLRA
jgi:hypothetical protein